MFARRGHEEEPQHDCWSKTPSACIEANAIDTQCFHWNVIKVMRA